MKTINITLKIEKEKILKLEEVLRDRFEVVGFKIMPNTGELYENNNTFKKLVKAVKNAQDERDKFINLYG